MTVILTVGGDGPHLAPSQGASAAINSLPDAPEIQQELDAMVTDLKNVEMDIPDEVIRLCTAYMARCVELHLKIVRIESQSRTLKWIRTQQLAKVIDLIEFVYRSSSRVIEVRRQDVELSR